MSPCVLKQAYFTGGHIYSIFTQAYLGLNTFLHTLKNGGGGVEMKEKENH